VSYEELKPAKNFMFLFSGQKIKKEILLLYSLRITRKGKLMKNLHSHKKKRLTRFMQTRSVALVNI
jgi:hypothetical protein